MARTLYDAIRVFPTATQAEIEGACLRLGERYKRESSSGNASATSRFAEIEKAYEVLSNPEKRVAYDLSLAQTQPHRSGRNRFIKSFAIILLIGIVTATAIGINSYLTDRMNQAATRLEQQRQEAAHIQKDDKSSADLVREATVDAQGTLQYRSLDEIDLPPIEQRKVIGTWLRPSWSGPCTWSIESVNRKVYRVVRFSDGSGGTTGRELSQVSSNKFLLPTSSTGDNYVILANGNLSVRDNDGEIDVDPKHLGLWPIAQSKAAQ